MNRTGQTLDANHPVVRWVRREVLPLLEERLRPTQVVVFDPPDRTAALSDHPPGLLVVSAAFRGMPVAERPAVVRALLAATSPVRPMCLTPEEYTVSRQAPGTVLAAVRTGIRLR